MYESNDKMVSHPSHYQSETGLEVIDVIEAFTFDLKGIDLQASTLSTPESAQGLMLLTNSYFFIVLLLF